MGLTREQRKERDGLFAQGLKRCCVCKEPKPFEEFNKNKSRFAGISCRCRPCEKAQNRRRNANGPRARAKRERDALHAQGLKKCSACKEIKPFSGFTKKKRNWDGLCSQCKDCVAEWREEYRGDPENVAKELASSRAWKERNYDYVLEYSREWAAANPERKRELKRQWHLENKESENAKARVRSKQWAKDNPEKHRTNGANYRARSRGAPGQFTKRQWSKLKKLCNHHCVMCGKKKKLCRDHVIPLTHPDTSNWIGNIQPLCKKCNSTKRDVDRTDYRPVAVREWAIQETQRQMERDGHKDRLSTPSPLRVRQLALGI